MPDAEPREAHQTVTRLPDDQPDVGPYYPSGMSAPEAANAGAVIPESEQQEGEATQTKAVSKKEKDAE